MSSVNEALKLLEEKLDDLQRDTKFCVNNYDYYHKNDQCEIIQNLEEILEDSIQDAQQYHRYMKNVRFSIDTARQKCLEIDELLIRLGVKTESSNTAENCPAGSHSFREEQEASNYGDGLEEYATTNK